MRLSRSKKVVLAGAVVLAVGLAGRAFAAETTPATHTDAAVKATVTSASAPASPSPTVSQTPAKPPVTPTQGTTQKPAQPPVTPPVAPPVAPPKYTGKTVLGGAQLSTGSKAVALTFDDGPDPATTPTLLKMLAQQHVHATFCLVGQNVQRHPELVRAIVAGGHTLCNHTWHHDEHLGKKPVAVIKSDLARTNAAILKAAPGAKIKYYRAPGGNFTPQMVAIAKQLGMASLYWKVDPRDWDHPKGESDAAHKARVIHIVEKNTRAGAIVLSHDYAQPDTIAAYRTLLPWLKQRFQLVAMPV